MMSDNSNRRAKDRTSRYNEIMLPDIDVKMRKDTDSTVAICCSFLETTEIQSVGNIENYDFNYWYGDSLD